MKHANERIGWERLNKLGVEVSKLEADGATMALFDVDEVSMLCAAEYDRQTAEQKIAANLALLEGMEPGDRLILPNGVSIEVMNMGDPSTPFLYLNGSWHSGLDWARPLIEAAIRGGARVVKAGGA